MKLAIYSIRVRFLFSVLGNTCRGALNFLTNLLIARFLLPNDYGQLSFLLTSFLAITQLFDQGVVAAFYTFITRERTRVADYIIYALWLLLQLILLILFIAWLGSDTLIHLVWNDNPRRLILLAFLALFARQVIWTTVTQIVEAQRKTILIQLLSVLSMVFFLIMVLIFQYCFDLNVRNVLIIMIVTFCLFSLGTLCYLISWRGFLKVLRNFNSSIFSESLKEYYRYCKPLFFMAIVTFFYTFLDNWMLNRFAGSTQQGYYQIANQFMTICLLASTSMMRVFWKEFSVLHSSGASSEKMYQLYNKAFRIVLLFSAVCSGFLIPWAKEIVFIMLGEPYLPGYLVLLVMFIYPVYSSASQIFAAVYSATSKTTAYAFVNILPMALSIPVTYYLLAPKTGVFIPGLHLDALGLALKMVVLGILSVNFMQYVLCRLNSWRFDWQPQFICVGFCFILGYAAKTMISYAWLSASPSFIVIGTKMLACFVLYLSLMALVIFWQPGWLLGMSRGKLVSLFNLKG
jgi:O-antigen/teichoic acid export membrane protein